MEIRESGVLADLIDDANGISDAGQKSHSPVLYTDSRRLIDPFAALVVVVGIYWFVIVAVQTEYSVEPWVTGDWLVNYSAGFVRRGLIGEIVRRLYYLAGINPVSVVLGIKAVLYGLISLGLALLAARRRIDWFDLALLISPPAFAFEMYDALGTGRKEIALIAAFIAYLAIDTVAPDGRAPRRWRFWFLLIALPLLTLIHEGLFFFLPFFFVYEGMKHDNLLSDLPGLAIPFLAVAGAFLLSYIFRGDHATAMTVCSSVTAMSLDRRLCNGAILALSKYRVDIGATDVARYLLVAGTAFAPLMWYAARRLDMTHRRRLFVGVSLSMTATLPLYFVSEDWGRWIHVTWMLTFAMILALKSTVIRPVARTRFATVLYVLATVIYVFSWRVPHWIHSPVPILRWI